MKNKRKSQGLNKIFEHYTLHELVNLYQVAKYNGSASLNDIREAIPYKSMRLYQ